MSGFMQTLMLVVVMGLPELIRLLSRRQAQSEGQQALTAAVINNLFQDLREQRQKGEKLERESSEKFEAMNRRIEELRQRSHQLSRFIEGYKSLVRALRMGAGMTEDEADAAEQVDHAEIERKVG